MGTSVDTQADGGSAVDPLIPGAAARTHAAPEGKIRYSALYDEELIEHMRDIAWWRRQTLSGLARSAFRELVERLHSEAVLLTDPVTGETIRKPADEPYPPRNSPLKRGRPIS